MRSLDYQPIKLRGRNLREEKKSGWWIVGAGVAATALGFLLWASSGCGLGVPDPSGLPDPGGGGSGTPGAHPFSCRDAWLCMKYEQQPCVYGPCYEMVGSICYFKIATVGGSTKYANLVRCIRKACDASQPIDLLPLMMTHVVALNTQPTNVCVAWALNTPDDQGGCAGEGYECGTDQ